MKRYLLLFLLDPKKATVTRIRHLRVYHSKLLKYRHEWAAVVLVVITNYGP